MARLRKALDDPEALVTTPAGYRLRARPGELDVERFERLVADGRGALGAGRGEDAAAALGKALELWRGPPLAELASTPFAPGEIARLEEQRLAAVELRVEADLAAGRHTELIAELGQLTREHPWRERLHAPFDARAVSQRPPGRRAGGLPPRPRGPGRAARRSSPEPSSTTSTRRSSRMRPRMDAAPDGDSPGSTSAAARSQVARAAESDDRSRAATSRRSAARLGAPVGAAVDADRAGRGREDTARARGGPRRRGGFRRRRVLRARSPPCNGAEDVPVGDRQRARDHPARRRVARARRPSASSRPRTCCSSLTTSSTCSPPRRSSATCWAPAPRADGARHQPRAARRCRPRSAIPCRHCAAEPGAAGRWRRRCGDSVQSSGRAPTTPPLISATATRRRSRRSAGASTGCRWRSSSPRPAADCCRPPRSPSVWRSHLALPAPRARDAPARHHTLRATIDWSYELLSDGEKACFARFAVFVGGATIEAAEAVTGADLDTLDHLVSKSLLVRRQHAHAPTRLQMLETIRAYAAERLAAAADRDAVHERHYRHYLAVAERHGTEQLLLGVGGKEHLSRLDQEMHNFDAALRWAVGRPDAGPALAMVAALGSVLAHARPLCGRGRLDRPGVGPAGRRRPSGGAGPRAGGQGLCAALARARRRGAGDLRRVRSRCSRSRRSQPAGLCAERMLGDVVDRRPVRRRGHGRRGGAAVRNGSRRRMGDRRGMGEKGGRGLQSPGAARARRPSRRAAGGRRQRAQTRRAVRKCRLWRACHGWRPRCEGVRRPRRADLAGPRQPPLPG